MANGPPTPPATAAELVDDAKENPSNVPAALEAEPQQAPLKPNAFQLVFPTIANLAAQGKLQELIQVAEQTEISCDGDRYQSRLLVLTPLVLAYLILDELPPARYALTRLPENILTLPLCQALLNLLASTWERKYAMVYSRADGLFHMIEQSDFVDAKVIAGMVTTFVESFRRKTFDLLSKAYTSIPLPLAQTYLGLPGDQLLAISEGNGWLYDASTQILTPTPKTSLSLKHEIPASSLDTFHFVATSVAKLEI